MTPSSPTFDALGFRFTISCAIPELNVALRDLLEPLATTGRPDHEYVLAEGERPDAVDIDLNGQRLVSDTSPAGAVESILWWINREAVEAWPGVVLHGGCVSNSSRSAALIVATSGAGKSTLTAALVEAGLGYQSDEFIALGGDGRSITAFPRPISLKPGAWPLLPRLAEIIEDARSVSSGSVCFVNPKRIPSGHVVSTARAGLIVLLATNETHGAPLTVESVRPAAALVSLVEQSFRLRELGPKGLDALARLVRPPSLPVISLRGGTVPQRLEVVAQALAAASVEAAP